MRPIGGELDVSKALQLRVRRKALADHLVHGEMTQLWAVQEQAWGLDAAECEDVLVGRVGDVEFFAREQLDRLCAPSAESSVRGCDG